MATERKDPLLGNVKEPLRSWLIGAFFLITGFFSVMSIHFGDLSKTPFGWTLWDVCAIVAPILFIGGILKLRSLHKSADKGQL